MFNKTFFKTLGVVAMLMVSGSMWAAGTHSTHYGKFAATTPGNGKVYVSFEEGRPADWSTLGTTSETEVFNCGGSAGADSRTAYYYAQPDKEGYTFAGWFNGNNKVSTDLDYAYTASASATNANNPTVRTLTAMFAWDEAATLDATGDHLYLYTTAAEGKYINAGANWDTQAIMSNDGLSLNITQTADKLVTLATATNKYIYDAGGYNIYTDGDANSARNFYFIGNNEDGYKIVIPNDVNYAIGLGQENVAGVDYTVLKLVPVGTAPLWKIGKMDKVTINVAAGQYATFVAPFDVAVPTNVAATTVESINANGITLRMTNVADRIIKANTPVVLYNSGTRTVTSEGYGFSKPIANPTAGLLTGVYEDTPAPVGTYVLQNQPEKFGVGFYKVEEIQPTIKAGRAYLTAPAEARFLSLDGEETAIETLNAKTSVDGKFVENNNIVIVKNGKKFNVAGQRVK